MKRICSLILSGIIVASMLAGCQKIEKSDDDQEDAVESTQSDSTGEIISNNENVPVIEIVSDIATLYYPEKWSDNITVDKRHNTVSFTSNGTRLFDFVFGGTEGTLLGYYDGVEVRIMSYEIIEDNYTENEYITLRAMQEDIDIVIEHLIEDKKFILD